MHCPGSNLKLGSGLAPVVELRRRGVTVSLGADGAACNNRLDMFGEMRLAAMLQAVRLGPGLLSARDVVWMATRGGARTLGLDAEIGSIEVGKRADVIVVGRDGPAPGAGARPLRDPGLRHLGQRRPDDRRRRAPAGRPGAAHRAGPGRDASTWPADRPANWLKGLELSDHASASDYRLEPAAAV